MTKPIGATLPSDSNASGDDAGVLSAFVVRAFSCDRPLEAPSRHWLDGRTSLTLGRGDATTTLRTSGAVALAVLDPRLSTKHFLVERTAAGTTLRDLGSTNGTRVNGTPCTEVQLEDGDVIEAGRTFFVFRESVRRLPGTPLDDEASIDPRGERMTSLSPELERALLLSMRIAPSRVPVLLSSESGTGKEVFARAIHRASGRDGDLVAVNCASIPQQLAESILFGHKKGAFSGATEDRPGLVRSADGGTLFLDEIGDLSASGQAALLRVLQEREVLPVGAVKPIPVDFRLVAATHRSLKELTASGGFRADLLARISGYELHLVPVRDRREDLGILVGALLRRHAGPTAERTSFATAAARALFAYDWPLNVRELERCLEAAAVLAGAGPIALEHLPAAVRAPPPADEPALGGGAADAERRHRDELVALLAEHDGNVSAVARATGKARMQIQRWMKRYGIPSPRG